MCANSNTHTDKQTYKDPSKTAINVTQALDFIHSSPCILYLHPVSVQSHIPITSPGLKARAQCTCKAIHFSIHDSPG